jgi:MFS family permease
LSESQSSVGSLDPTTLASYAASIVLMCGALGQGIAGRIARPARLRGLLVAVMLANVPCLIWMARAEGIDRFWAACLFGLVHFMNQPIYNSLIAHYVPHHRRSTGYGFSNMMCFGIGAIGPAIAGAMPSLGRGFWLLALLAVVATLTAGCLWLLTAGDGRKPAVH